MVVENRISGVGGAVAIQSLARARPDGHTLLTGFSPLATVKHVHRLEVYLQAGKFLREWLIRHIMVSDKHYAAYLLGTGVLPN